MMEWNENNSFSGFVDSSYYCKGKLRTNENLRKLNVDTDVFTQMIENKNHKMISEDGY